MMVAEALEALWTLLIAGGVWLLLGAALLALTLAVTLLAAVAALRGAWTAAQRLRSPRRRPRPSWALTRRLARRHARTRRTPDYEEAA
ncbi:hypothetical protein KVH27_19400 [Streptomyces olivaceus]|uniref:hypothetical protein n=1 Tax=Streptomyces olivaceus TaxID=47716 RepID=UPI001CCBE66B|nr:hypothetical protein [Streptomyces olivaceus]MBZ6250534.1 hypothetical protein [Streptomyces olivaceus]